MARPWSRLLAVLVCAAPGLVLALSGCGGSAAVSSAVDPVAQAAQVSEMAPGFKVSLTEEVTFPGTSEAATGSGTGVIDQRDHRGAMRIQTHAEGHSLTTEAQFSDLALYTHSSSTHKSSLTHGRSWIKVDLRSVGAALGVNLSVVWSPASSSDPCQLLSYLKATSGKVTRIGAEPLQGVPTTHYRATIDYDQYAHRVAPAQRATASQSIAALERLTGVHSQLVDVWVDGRRRVRQEEFTLRQCLPGVAGRSQIHIKMDFFDFGIQALSAPPPSNEVADLTSYVSEKLKLIKLGCQ